MELYFDQLVVTYRHPVHSNASITTSSRWDFISFRVPYSPNSKVFVIRLVSAFISTSRADKISNQPTTKLASESKLRIQCLQAIKIYIETNHPLAFITASTLLGIDFHNFSKNSSGMVSQTNGKTSANHCLTFSLPPGVSLIFKSYS